MKRSHFIKGIFGFGLLSTLWSCQTDSDEAKLAGIGGAAKSSEKKSSTKVLRQELTEAWLRSETMTMTNVEQMPPEFFTFKYTDEAMTFSEQWRHCVIYTCGQLTNNTSITNPYADIKLPVQMPKEDVIKELKTMYSFIRQSIEDITDEELLGEGTFAGVTIPIWRLFYALENHIIHHRGQCIVYLRLNGIKPKGYYGW
ncbi:MAG: DinB family protein [Bacteroidota bacterium]